MDSRDAAHGAFSGIRVIDLAGTVATAYCGKMLRDQGAEVTLLEAPGTGHPIRRLAPFRPGAPVPEASGLATWLSLGKRSVAAEPGDPVAQALLAEADVVLDTLDAEPGAAIDTDALHSTDSRPGQIRLTVSWFGASGPWRGRAGTDQTIGAHIGAARSVGPADGPPILTTGHTAQIVAGTLTFVAAAGHLLARHVGGLAGGTAAGAPPGPGPPLACTGSARPASPGGSGKAESQPAAPVHLDVSILEAAMCMTEPGPPGSLATGEIRPRIGINRFWPTWPTGIYPCRDGWVGVTTVTPAQWRGLCSLLGLPELGSDPRYQVSINRLEDADALDAAIAPRLLQRTALEWVEAGQAARVPLALAPTPAELFELDQFRERGAWVDAHHPDQGTFKVPGTPFRLHRTPAAGSGSAPRLGEHGDLVARELATGAAAPGSRASAARPTRRPDRDKASSGAAAAGQTRTEAPEGADAPGSPDAGMLPRLASAADGPPGAPPAAGRSPGEPAAENPAPGAGPRRPELLRVIRIVDLTMGWAGPLATRQLADMGAEVLKVESCQYFDWWRGWESTAESVAQNLHEQSTAFQTTGRNKHGLTLDLTSRSGKDLLLRLVARSDAVIENYAASVLPNLGLGWEQLREANPELVMVSMPPFGSSGCWKYHRAYGSTVEQASGLPHLNGRASDPPTMQHVALGDPIAGIHAAAALLAALLHRRRTGEGQYVDLSHVESVFPLAAHGQIEQAMLGRPPVRDGGRHPLHAPWGAWPCIGTEPWIVITVETDRQWRGLCAVLELDATDPRFADAAQRKAHEDDLDRMIAAATALHDGMALERRLAAAAVPAAVVRNTMDVLHDPHLEARGYWQWRERAFVGSHPNPSAPYRPFAEGADSAPFAVESPAPTLGQHGREVLQRLLGLTEADLDALEADHVIGTKPVLKRYERT